MNTPSYEEALKAKETLLAWIGDENLDMFPLDTSPEDALLYIALNQYDLLN